MDIRIKGAGEHNLKNVDVRFGDGLTVVTGVSGSGKSSLVFDTLYHEAHRRFLDVYLYGKSRQRLAPARVESISGLGPATAVGQNLLNRNPGSTVATASGLHPFFRLLFANYGARYCVRCGNPLRILTEDEIIECLVSASKHAPVDLFAPLMTNAAGSHKTLLSILAGIFGNERLFLDGKPWNRKSTDPQEAHSIEIMMGTIDEKMPAKTIRAWIREIIALGAGAVQLRGPNGPEILATTRRCSTCGNGFKELNAAHFNQSCPFCRAKGCEQCGNTGMHPQAASVRWEKMRLPELLKLTVEDAGELFKRALLPSTANRLRSEILKRLDSLEKVGLGYLSLDRTAPSLSRGESQRVRLAISLSGRLEDMLHILDEPTIGQHPADIEKFLPAFRKLAGPVIYVEHDRAAAASADHAIDIGPDAGTNGGRVVFSGSPDKLWIADTPTGRYFSLREKVMTPKPRPVPDRFMTIRKANAHNLKSIDVTIPLGRLTVITGVSGSGKSSLVEDVILQTLEGKSPTGCSSIDCPNMRPVMVDQSPIGRNPRSNPATYTKLSEVIRDLFADASGLSKSYFSFNRSEGACPACEGIGATEVQMRYLPSLWIPCEECGGLRFNQKALSATLKMGDRNLTIAELYGLPIQEASGLLSESPLYSSSYKKKADGILKAFRDVGLGYLQLGQPSTTLSGGEAQRVKLTKYLGRNNLKDHLLILDEPSTGLHPRDLNGLLLVLDRLVRSGATIIVVEHNTDFMRAADWIVDLGPGAGPRGGSLLYQGPPGGICSVQSSLTGRAFKQESEIKPRKPEKIKQADRGIISIRNARANNLKGVNIDIPKNKLTVVTGVSGSGKSSLVINVLEAEARRRFLESLSMYERQGTSEGPQAMVDSISGLGVTLSVEQGLHVAHLWSRISLYTRRSSVGAVTELRHHLANVLALTGERKCLKCGTLMEREGKWLCPGCKAVAPVAKSDHFSGSHYSSSCDKCSGIGSLQAPHPEKLIVNPDKPLAAGAMYSPGYFPETYLCKDNPIIPALGNYYGFDPYETPWNKMSEKARNAFLYGDGNTYTLNYLSKSANLKGQERTRKLQWHGFYGKSFGLADWDFHETYTSKTPCDLCGGTGYKPEYLAVTLLGKNIHELSEMPLAELEKLVKWVPPPSALPSVAASLMTAARRLEFLRKVGLGYLNLNRPAGTLSAGEAQRIQLASLLGSGLTSLTVLIDEPSRGMHPSELEALRDALLELRNGNNTVIVVEHDLLMIRAADYVIDMGPGAGASGGSVVAKGKPGDIIKAKSITGKWLEKSGRKPQEMKSRSSRREPKDWMILRGARENNLKEKTIRFPMGVLMGVCGVSGSGKSTLLIDTIGRALVKKHHTSSVAHEPVRSGAHDAIENSPKNTIIVDQSRREIWSPAKYLGLIKPMMKVFSESDDAQALGMNELEMGAACSSCCGWGYKRIPMGFLPDEYVECEACGASGFRPEAWEIRVNGVPLPHVHRMTFDEVYEKFREAKAIANSLQTVRQVCLGYLVWNQPGQAMSGGEAQRLKIARELNKKAGEPTLYILDEPTLGLHMEDVSRLIRVLNLLVDAGHTVAIVEHHPHVLAACDWLIELGSGGGPDGGRVIAEGPPESIVKKNTPTSPYLRELLG
ncbi:MAG: ATP-binding cassette domain-containing protein [Acidobacteria bacterium]|nr:ATP-binding cassette domain-containing protein [Acidobacteriota bacterium]